MEELKKEIKEHERALLENRQIFNKLQTMIISKNGAIIELKLLIDND